MSIQPLTPQFHDALTITARRGETVLVLSADDRIHSVLAMELERALLERDYLDGYLEWIETNLFSSVYPRFEPDEAMLRLILTDGLQRLEPIDLHHLALDPVAMLSLRERIIEAMPDYWWLRLKELAPARKESDSAEEFWQALLAKLERDTARKKRRLAAVGAFHQTDTPPPRDTIGRSWMIELPIERATIEFTLRDLEKSQVLEVRLFGPLRLSSSVRCVARLLTRDGKEVSRGVNSDQVMRLPLSTTDMSGLRLECDWSKGGGVHQKFETPVLVSTT